MHDLWQLWMVLTSAVAVWAVARTDRWHRWGFVFGLLSEPAYVNLVLEAKPVQWGIIPLTAWWTWYWGVGAWRRFKKG